MEKRPAAWLWVVALVPTLVLGALRWSAGPGIGAEDYAQYELHAHALARGLPYRDTGYLPSPLNAGHGPGVLPPGVPAVLAVAYRVLGEQPAATKPMQHFDAYSSHNEWGIDHFGFTYRGDLRAYCEKLRQKGVRMAVAPWEFKPGLVLCYVAAPDGVSIEIVQINA